MQSYFAWCNLPTKTWGRIGEPKSNRFVTVTSALLVSTSSRRSMQNSFHQSKAKEVQPTTKKVTQKIRTWQWQEDFETWKTTIKVFLSVTVEHPSYRIWLTKSYGTESNVLGTCWPNLISSFSQPTQPARSLSSRSRTTKSTFLSNASKVALGDVSNLSWLL